MEDQVAEDDSINMRPYGPATPQDEEIYSIRSIIQLTAEPTDEEFSGFLKTMERDNLLAAISKRTFAYLYKCVFSSAN
jgi:hypothetical protein